MVSDEISKKVNILSYPKHAEYLLKQAIEILRCARGLCRPLQVFRANHFFEEFRHQSKDDVKLTSAQMPQLVSLWFFAVSENLIVSTFDIVKYDRPTYKKLFHGVIVAKSTNIYLILQNQLGVL